MTTPHIVARTRPALLLATLLLAAALPALSQTCLPIPGEAGNDSGFDMAPETSDAVVRAAVAHLPNPMAPGPVEPTWASLASSYRVPQWLVGARFGIFIHFGIFSVPAHGNEWYEKFLYAGGNDSVLKVEGGTDEEHTAAGPTGTRAWHTAHFGPPETFGYKDFIPLFKAEHFDPDAWALLFHQAGARFVLPGAQHHENFAMWNSQVTPFNSVRMGPHRDILGDLAVAVRKQGLKFGVANHGIENFEFINPPADLADRLKAAHADLYDPQWADFYNVADRSNAAMQRFLINWYQRNVELIDLYQPDLIYFDNGIDQRYLDPLKLEVAAFFYNRARAAGKEVSLVTKKAAFAPSGTNTRTIGSVLDFEGTPPPGIRSGTWINDRPIGSSWGYIDGMRANSPATVLGWLVDTVSKNGTLLLNVSPRADGTIPDDQQATLRSIGAWLRTNGEAIYDTHSWTSFQDTGDHNTGHHGTGHQGTGDQDTGNQDPTDQHTPDRDTPDQPVYFTAKGNILYSIALGHRHPASLSIHLLPRGGPAGSVRSVTLLGLGPAAFTQDAAGLHVTLSPAAQAAEALVLRIAGLTLNPPESTPSGNPAPVCTTVPSASLAAPAP